ncbi:hypothetical protein JMJ58_14925 [Haloterrigena salifodinae]|uniref:Uncharacterized protein n=1 Tax=Haloterrigena salifodinae TaxID=2675099 RepID=A0A8T8DXY5_9EURY|nr:hypothetical protein [Haloterrigena salifodinae]QRV14227.1 hypothetical protein JMJ58_14925 [Haloterrigena salifodinae]
MDAQNGVYRHTLTRTIDDFEHNDVSMWQSDGSGTWDIQSTTVYEGNYAGQLTDGMRVWTHPNWGSQDHFPQAGDYWEFYFHLDQHDGQVRLYFARDDVDGYDSSLGYRFQMYSAGAFRIRDHNGDNLAETYDVNYDLGTWYRVRHWWKHPDYNADHRAELYDLGADTQVTTISGDNVDVDRDSGGVMLYSNSGAAVQFDDLNIPQRTA